MSNKANDEIRIARDIAAKFIKDSTQPGKEKLADKKDHKQEDEQQEVMNGVLKFGDTLDLGSQNGDQSESKLIADQEPLIDGLPAHQPLQQIKISPIQKKDLKKSTVRGDISAKLNEYDFITGEFILHARLNKRLYNQISQLGKATKSTQSKIIGFAVTELFVNNPELKDIINKHLEELEL